MYTKNKVLLDDFLDAVTDETPVLKALNISEVLIQASFEELLDNPDDIGVGVTKVEKKFDTIFFGVFDSILVKHHDDGSIRYVFYGLTSNANFIFKAARLFNKKLGTGLYDDDQYSHFGEVNKVVKLSQGKYKERKDEPMQTWLNKKCSITLNYRIRPMRQLVLSITQKATREVDSEIRTKGTIAQLLRFDFDTMLATKPIAIRETTIEAGVTKFTDYNMVLAEPKLGVFDRLTVRIFGENTEYSHQSDVNVILSVSQVPTFYQMLSVVEQLTKLYGKDQLGSHQLESHEIDTLQLGKHWTGRSWHLNEIHAPYSHGEAGAAPAYYVMLSHDGQDISPETNGFTLSILGYNKMTELFD